jgi:hypothetical protein
LHFTLTLMSPYLQTKVCVKQSRYYSQFYGEMLVKQPIQVFLANFCARAAKHLALLLILMILARAQGWSDASDFALACLAMLAMTVHLSGRVFRPPTAPHLKSTALSLRARARN